MTTKIHFRSNDVEGQLWQQRTADRLRQALVPVRARTATAAAGDRALSRLRLERRTLAAAEQAS